MLKIGLFPPSGFRDTEFILRMEPDGVMAREKAAASGCESLARLLAALIIIIIVNNIFIINRYTRLYPVSLTGQYVWVA